MIKERNHIFDLLCGICIIRMIFLHVMGFCGMSGQNWWVQIMQWSYFFMSFFFFKAGYFNRGVKGDTRTYLINKTKRLFVPYLSAGWIGLLIYFFFLPFLMHRYHTPIEPLQWSHIWEKGGFYGNNPTWFLLSFFVSYVLIHLLEKVKYARWVVITFPFVSYWLFRIGNPLWMGANNVFIGVFFFYLGHVWRLAMKRFTRTTSLTVSIALTLAFLLLNFLFPGNYTMSENSFSGSFLALLPKTVFALCGISGILLEINMPRIPLLCFIGEHSMVYFISHYPMIYIYKFTHLCFGRSIYGHPDDAFILLPVIFCLCSWLVPIVERMPWLSGRWSKT